MLQEFGLRRNTAQNELDCTGSNLANNTANV